MAAQPYPLLFTTISGAHLYGFPSPDSDYDLRGTHVLPLDAIVGLGVRDQTVQDERSIDQLEMDRSAELSTMSNGRKVQPAAAACAGSSASARKTRPPPFPPNAVSRGGKVDTSTATSTLHVNGEVL